MGRGGRLPSPVTILMAGGALVAFLFLISPLIVVIPNGFSAGTYLLFPPPGISLRWFSNFFSNETWTDATIMSFQVAIGASVLATVAGTSAAVALDSWSFRGKNLLLLLLLSPLVIPVVIIGIAAYTFFVTINLYGSVVSMVLAHAILGVPYVLISVTAALNQQDPRLRMAALSLGASPWKTFREITLPLSLPGIVGGMIMAFIISFDEVVIATFLASIRTTTLPMRMFQAVQAELDPTIAAASTLLIVFAALLLSVYSVVEAVQRRNR
jgi:putative spermidine/putrescine transport system permease protein